MKFPTLKPNCNNAHYRKCLCGFDVHQGTFIFALVGIFSNALLSINGFFGPPVRYFLVTNEIVAWTAVLCNVLLLIGNLKLQPRFYWPFLIINTLITSLMAVSVFGFYLVGILLFAEVIKVNPDYDRLFSALSFVTSAIYTFACIMQFYVLFVVFRHLPKDDEYFTCCCNRHVHQGTRIYCIVSIINHVPFALHGFLVPYAFYWPFPFVLGSATIICYSLLLFGNIKRRPRFYWPFFTVNVGVKILSALFVVGLFVVGSLVMAGHFDVPDENRVAYGAIAFILAALYMFVILLQVYVYLIVAKDYAYVKEAAAVKQKTRTTTMRTNEYCFFCHFKGDERMWKDYMKRRITFIIGFILFKMIIMVGMIAYVFSSTRKDLSTLEKAGIYASVIVPTVLSIALISFVGLRRYRRCKEALRYYPQKILHVYVVQSNKRIK
ncbi:hypothetical protein M3Y99_00459700 [Aphelenchoides fujianensis]|nr:hypothetical protein M3Y99_00459700 [Aphelenchoides fujianensis]